MKKILLIFGLVIISLIGNSQLVKETVKVTEYIIIQGDTIRLDSPIDGEVLKRIGGVWTNGTGGAGSAAVDSLLWNSTTGDLGWYISGSIAGTESLDGRYIEIVGGDYYTQSEVDDIVANAEKNVYHITLPVAPGLSQSVSAAVESSEGTDDGNYPFGWTLNASGNDLQIFHGLGRYSYTVNVFSDESAGMWRQYRNFQEGYSGILLVDEDNMNVEQVITDYHDVEIKIVIAFE
jgi:hypothetical protein